MDELSPITPKLAEQLLRHSWTDSTKMGHEVPALTAELLRLLVVEAIHRAAAVAREEGAHTIEPEHIEQILPQLLLDF